MKKISFSATIFVCLFLVTTSGLAQNIYSAEPVQIVGQFNGYSSTPYNSDYRTMTYRKISTVIDFKQDGRGQWSTTVNVQTSGGDVTPLNMPGGLDSGFRFVSGPSSNRMQYKWNYNGIFQTVPGDITNLVYQTGQDVGLDMSNLGYYTFNFRDTDYTVSEFYCGYTSATPVTVSRISEIINNDQSCSVNILLNNPKSLQEHIYVRYRNSTNDFSTGTSVVEATGTGTSYLATIPAAACGSAVYYYVYSSTRTLSQIINDSDRDRFLSTLKYDDNAGTNYSYVVSTSNPTISCSSNTPCAGNNLNLSSVATGGFSPYSFLWSGPNSFSSTIQNPQIVNATSMDTGIYQVTVTDFCGNTTSTSLTASLLIISANEIVTNVICKNDQNGAINLSPSGGNGPYSFLWNTGSTNEDISGLASGTYQITITDFNNCSSVSSLNVLQPANSMSVTISKLNPSCSGKINGSITFVGHGGWGSYSYLWNTGSTSANTGSLAPGTYTVTVSDISGCTATKSGTITQNPAMQIIMIPTGNGTALASASGGVSPYSFEWNTNPIQTTSVASGLLGGVVYKVNISDSKNCKITGKITLAACNTPGSLSVSNITGTSVNLNWGAVNGALNYDLQYSQLDSDLWTTINTGPTAISISGLQINTEYEWKVRSHCFYGLSAYSLGNNFTTSAPCGLVIGLTTGTITSGTAVISWTAVSGAINYTVQYRRIGFATWSTVTTSSLSTTLTSLNQSTTYEVQVAANCVGNSGAFSSSVSFTTSSSSAADTLIATNSSWKYLDNGSNQGTAWTATGFNDASWVSGNAELGYGDGDEATIVSYGPNANTKYTTTYFRKTINVTNPLLYSNLTLNVVRDDGAVVYINGVEVMRSNMPTGTISYNTFSSAVASGTDESAWQAATVASSNLLAGTNVIAVEIHQSDLTSSDVSFNLRLAGNQGTLTTLTRSAYIQVVTPTSFRIRWRTSTATNSQVRYGTTMSYGNVVTDNTSTTEHEILVSGLTANTKYYYTIGSTTQDLKGDASFYCITSLPTGSTTPFRIWATGDFGTNTSGQTNTRDAMNTYCGTNLPKLWLWMGDNAYNSGTDAEFTSNVFNIYPNQMKNIPIYPCLGNHDYANVGYKSTSALTTNFPYFSMFTCPTNGEAGGVASTTEKYYSYNYGNVHFIVLDSYGALNASGTEQYNWLQSDLAANTQRFTIAMWHHSPYTMGTHNSDTEVELIDMRNNINPLLEQYKVDLVLNGHSHVYERTWLIKGHFGLENTFNNSMKVDTTNGLSPYYLKTTGSDFDGTVYCVCGCSGQGGVVTAQGSWPHAAMRQYSKALFGSMIIDFSADTLDAKFVTSTGTVYDRFKIVKSGPSRLSSSTIYSEMTTDLEAFPNPFNQALNLRFKLETESKVIVEVFNMLGEKIYTTGNKIKGLQKPGTYELQITSEELRNAKGMMIIKVKSDSTVLQTIVNRID